MPVPLPFISPFQFLTSLRTSLDDYLLAETLHWKNSMKELNRKDPVHVNKILSMKEHPEEHRAAITANERKWYEFFDTEIPDGIRGREITEVISTKQHKTRRKSKNLEEFKEVEEFAAAASAASSITAVHEEEFGSGQTITGTIDEFDEFVSFRFFPISTFFSSLHTTQTYAQRPISFSSIRFSRPTYPVRCKGKRYSFSG